MAFPLPPTDFDVDDEGFVLDEDGDRMVHPIEGGFITAETIKRADEVARMYGALAATFILNMSGSYVSNAMEMLDDDTIDNGALCGAIAQIACTVIEDLDGDLAAQMFDIIEQCQPGLADEAVETAVAELAEEGIEITPDMAAQVKTDG